jgi:hypothetical protein
MRQVVARRAHRRPSAAVLLCLSLLVACEFPSRSERYACESMTDCEQGRVCDDGYCVRSPVDAGNATDARDAASQDAAIDSGPSLAMICPPAGYTLAAGPNGYYRTITTGASWTNAQAACAAHVPGSTHLIVLSTTAEVSYAATQVAGTQVAWIGLSDIAAETQFVTVTGETGDQRPWSAGEPNNGGGVEDCAVAKSNAQLDDRPCGTGYRYICECDGRMSTP